MQTDALLFLSFGGPEGMDDVRPFLENVTAGRNVPPERLDEVAQHYLHFGGVSPINSLNRKLIEAVEVALAEVDIRLPVYFGNRNWHPMIEDTVARMADDGVGHALVFATSAWGGYSGCKQYHEDIARARRNVGPRAPELVKLRQFFDHPLFIESFAEAVGDALTDLGSEARLVFTAHSVPNSSDARPGPDGQGQRYSRQVAEAARLVAAKAGVSEYDVVWQSRSGPAAVPWLEPDIIDHLGELKRQGETAVVTVPIGFVSDHLEVLWDLDNEAAQEASELGLRFARAATPGTDPRFARMVAELVAEHVDDRPARSLSRLPSAGCTENGEPCAVKCCQIALMGTR